MKDFEKAVSDWKQGNYENCFQVIEFFAEKNNAEAQFILARSYSTEHWGKELNIDKSIEFYKLAAGNGHPHAALKLAMIFDPTTVEGTCEKDKGLSDYYYKLAFDEYLKGALAGVAESMHGLSNCYLNSFGVEYDEEKGMEWKRKSCTAGFDLACSELKAQKF